MRSYVAQRDGFGGGRAGIQGQRGLNGNMLKQEYTRRMEGNNNWVGLHGGRGRRAAAEIWNKIDHGPCLLTSATSREECWLRKTKGRRHEIGQIRRSVRKNQTQVSW